jgi:hypothetical protein
MILWISLMMDSPKSFAEFASDASAPSKNIVSAHSSAWHSSCLPAFRSVLPEHPCSLTALSARR